ncbi:uncharacterized protein LOC116189608 [Punica granatum]|uniref:Uncharacterized protein LOC116189608 n=2 Tax=Punica granatum TaxID=22663 RepID=A0A6P8BY20_PUNGR|nr:uncharacterized protein LOC116189608 [Punica granatum]PKI75652.1 hypothetical protein CRG98_003912 [Punica granatum]
MPRPGPRPYECVRRAWHSDRHQPMRGSLIQDIFRVVNEIHCPATKKNKEWQEKLPIVVLKAEEILYSKANSESEYMDLKTLLDRTTDAINTIIRRDESTETGDLLHPCIEAALTLGCTPRRASRSQRNCSPQRYLNSSSHEKTNLQKEIPSSDQRLCPSIFQTKFNHYPKTNHLLGSEKVALRNIDLSSVTQPWHPSSPYSIYPLYYGTDLPETNTPPCSCQILHEQSPENGNFQSSHNSSDELNEGRENGSEIHCDLSLRLGPNSVQMLSKSSTEASKLCSERARLDRELSFFPRMKNSTPIKTSLQGDIQMVDADISLK